MARAKERRLVDVLAQRTRDRTLAWEAAAGKDAYILSFASSSIIVGPDTTGSKRGIAIEITNDEGRVVDRFDGEELGVGTLGEGGLWSEKIRTIHEGARRTVLKSEVILDFLLERLEH